MPRRTTSLALAVLLALAPVAFSQATAVPPVQKGWTVSPPKELFEIERVVDGDTIHIRRNGEVVKLRLLSVDTEEKMSTQTGDASKPSTAFGEECAQWAAEFFAKLAEDGQPSRIGLAFPGATEERDVYGRLLCYVILPDGRNFNLMLVELGKSPYFNKYGNDPLCPAAYVEAQRAARAAQLGIWNPNVNEPKTPGAPAAKRPYDKLLPWWDARAAAVDAYRAAVKKDAAHVANSETPAELARALETSAKGEDVEVFGSIDRFFDEDDGSWTVLFRSGVKEAAFRAKIAKSDRERFAKLDLRSTNEEFRQNYLWVKGRVVKGPRGYDMVCDDPARWRLAGPEPVKD
jgi:micrococcal nuclease